MELSEKQKRFAEEYIEDLNATQAAIRSGYSKKTAYSQGQRMLKKVEIREYIDKMLSKVRQGNVATAEEIEEYLSSVMRGKQKEQTLISKGESGQEITDIEVSAKERIKAAELLGKRYSLWTDKIDLSASVEITFEDDYGEEG